MKSSHFAKHFRELRRQSGLTLEALGKKSGTQKGYLSGVENVKVNPPSAKVVRKLAAALGGDVAFMLTLAWVDKAPVEIRKDLASLLVDPQPVAEKV